MRLYSVEIFSRDFQLIQHYNATDPIYAYDYLSAVENSVLLPYLAAVRIGQYIRISDGDLEFFGVISAVDTGAVAAGYSEVKYKPFLSIFDQQILFDTDLQGSAVSLEQMIADQITAGWIQSGDTSQDVPGLSVTTVSTTTGWGFHLTSDVEGMHKCVINFQQVILMRALTKYRVACVVHPDFTQHTVTIEIGVPQAPRMTIEADLPSVIDKSFLLMETSQSINKVIVYDKADMVTNMTFYLHPDGSYDTTDADRMLPVLQAVRLADVEEGQSFTDAAYTLAGQDLGGMEYRNLIELTVLNDDGLVLASSMTIGQECDIISNGSTYTSIMTAIERGSVTKLTFGAVRVDLTQILKGRQ